MSTLTTKQFSYIRFLAEKNGFDSPNAAAREYGFDDAYGLSVSQASELIDWLKNGQSIISAEDRAAMAAAAEAAQAEKERADAAYAEKCAADQDARSERVQKTNEELARRGLAHLTGAQRRDARYAIQKELGI